MSDLLISPLGVCLPDGWDLRPIGELCVKIGSGATPKGGAAVYTDAGTRFIRSQNVFDHYFSSVGLAHIDDQASQKLAGVTVRERDVLLNITGDGETIARCCVAPDWVLPARVNQHVMILRPASDLVPEYLQRYLSQPAMRTYMLNHNSGGSRRALTKSQVAGFRIVVPPLEEQEAIAAVLGALDDKIAINERITATSRQIGLTLFARAILDVDLVEIDVESASSVLTRGIAPKYSECPEDLVVLNQKCVRNGRVSMVPARLTIREKVKSSKLLRRNDVLVNSTGVGTLGRVARWTSDGAATVDSHITIVRFDEAQVDPVCAGFAMLCSQPEIEAMGEGSTGQTELRRAQLGSMELTLPSRASQLELRPQLDALEERAEQALAESQALASLRDVLLPQLMSGRLRVKDAKKIVEDNT